MDASLLEAPQAMRYAPNPQAHSWAARVLLSAHRQGDFRVISAPVGDGYSGALSSMSRCV